jgi:O-antigen ligase
MKLLQAATIGLTTLIITPGYFFYFDITPKLLVLLAGAAACALLWAVEPGGGRGRSPFAIVLAASAVWLLIASALSTHPGLSFYGSTWRRFGAVAQLAILLLAWLIARNANPARTVLLRAIAGATTMAALYGIAQYFGWDPLLPKPAYHVGEGIWTIVRPPGTMGYVSYFATVLLMGGFLSLSLARSEPAPLARRLAYACAALCFIAMALTGTRAALLGLAAGLAFAAWVHGFRLSRRALGIVALAVLAGTAFYFSPAGWNLRSRVRWFREDPWGGARPLLYRDSLRMALSRPIAGFGPEVFQGELPHYESRELARAYPDFAHESPHNIFLDALVSQGLPGLACLTILCGMGLLAALRTGKPWLGAALAGGIVAQQFTVFTIPTALVFYAVIALCAAKPETEPAARFQLRLQLLPAGAIAIVFLYLAFRYGAADRSLELASRHLDAGDLASAQSSYRGYQRLRLPGATADLWYGRRLLALSQEGDPPHRLQALGMARIASVAATQSPEEPFNAWYTLAEVSAAFNDPGNVESSLRHAIQAKPFWFKPHWTLAQLLRLQGRASQAVAEASLAAGLDGGKHPEVARTLAQIEALQR